MKFSQRLNNMEESATIRMAQLARDLQEQGKAIISLSLGEPDFDTPHHIKQAAKEALDAGYTKYTPVSGLMELRQAICTKLRRDNQLAYEPSEIVVSNGAKQSIANVALSLLDPGDEVIIFSPYWVSYKEIVKMAEAEPVELYAGIEQDYKVSPTQLREALTARTKMILFSSPCNPTGSVYTEAELQALTEVLLDRPDIWVVADEIYEYINFGEPHTSVAALSGMRNRSITINGFSKGYAMTGWRLGYMAAPKAVADACAKIQGQFTSGANAFGQKAACLALLGDQSAREDMTQHFLRRRDYLIEALRSIEGLKVNVPQGAFYIFPDVSAYYGKAHGDYQVNSADDFCEYLLHEAQVATVTGAAFGAADCFRISYAASDETLKEAVHRMREALGKLQ